MGNHYHLLLTTPEPNLVEGMTWFQGAYTSRYNARHRKSGHLFGRRYKAVLVDDETGAYFRTALDYIHLNPVRAGIVRARRSRDGIAPPDLREFRWSSLLHHSAAPSKRPEWIDAAHAFSACERRDTPKGRRKFVTRLDRASPPHGFGLDGDSLRGGDGAGGQREPAAEEARTCHGCKIIDLTPVSQT